MSVSGHDQADVAGPFGRPAAMTTAWGGSWRAGSGAHRWRDVAVPAAIGCWFDTAGVPGSDHCLSRPPDGFSVKRAAAAAVLQRARSECSGKTVIFVGKRPAWCQPDRVGRIWHGRFPCGVAFTTRVQVHASGLYTAPGVACDHFGRWGHGVKRKLTF